MINQLMLALALGFSLLSSSACRVEIGTGKAIAAQSEAVAPTPVEGPHTENVTTTYPVPPMLPPTPSPSTPAPTFTPIPPTPTATRTPLVPAQGPPDHILAPAIGLDAAVMPVGWDVVERDGNQISVWTVPDDAAGWHQNSAWPGHGGNVVLSGHHNLGTEVFRHLVDLQPGDEVILHADDRDYPYVVTDRFILPDRDVSEEQRRQNAQWILPTTTERLTLVTCWPYTDNSHRVIVLANPASS